MQRPLAIGSNSDIAPGCGMVIESRIGIAQPCYNTRLRHWQQTATGHSHIHYIKALTILQQ
jgi:hypothetical protein